MAFEVDENGVPVLSADDIELKAEEVISYFDRQILDAPQKTPLLHFIEELHKKFRLGYDFSQSLGTTKHGNIILGKTTLKPLSLFIDQSLINDPRFSFILGHELGHVVLHRSVDVKRTGYEQGEIVDTENDMVTGKKILNTTRDWLEWHANYFAAAILMPRATVLGAVVAKQTESGIKRNLGHIILEAKGYSINDYCTVRKHLELVYLVNATNVECRLKDLGILIDRRDINTEHVSELFTTEK